MLFRNKYLIGAYFELKSSYHRDGAGLLLHLFFPILISQIVSNLWGNGLLGPIYVAMGYLGWDLFSRLLLDGIKFYSKYKIISETNLDFSFIFFNSIFAILLRFYLSYFLLILFYFNEIDVAYLWLFPLITPLAIGIYFIAILIPSIKSYFAGAITIYCRIGLYATPIFWIPQSDYVYLNPSAVFLQLIRLTVSRNQSSFLVIFLILAFSSLLINFFIVKRVEFFRKIVFKQYIKRV